MARRQIQHVVKEMDACGDGGFSSAVERQAEPNVRLGRLAMNGRGTRHQLRLSRGFQLRFISFTTACISFRVPMVIRTNPGPMSWERSRTRMPWRSSFANSEGPEGPKSARRKL